MLSLPTKPRCSKLEQPYWSGLALRGWRAVAVLPQCIAWAVLLGSAYHLLSAIRMVQNPWAVEVVLMTEPLSVGMLFASAGYLFRRHVSAM